MVLAALHLFVFSALSHAGLPSDTLYLKDGEHHVIESTVFETWRIVVRNDGCPDEGECVSPGDATSLTLGGDAIVYQVEVMDSSVFVGTGSASILDDLSSWDESSSTLEGDAAVSDHCWLMGSATFTMNSPGAYCATVRVGAESPTSPPEINLIEGEITSVQVYGGESNINISGGEITSLLLFGGDIAVITGGVLGGIWAQSGAEVTWSGGTIPIGDSINSDDGAHITIRGRDFIVEHSTTPLLGTVPPFGNIDILEGRISGVLENGDLIENVVFYANGFEHSGGNWGASSTIELIQTPVPAMEGSPLDITNTETRLVRIEVENSRNPRETATSLRANWDSRLDRYATWVSDGTTGLMAIAGGEHVRWLETRYQLDATSFSEMIFEVDVASGHFDLEYSGMLRGFVPMQSHLQSSPGPWIRSDGSSYPGSHAGFDLDADPVTGALTYFFCSDAYSTYLGESDCGAGGGESSKVRAVAYDSEKGTLMATGFMEVDGVPSFDTTGDLHLTETVATLAGPFDISDLTPRLIAIETETSANPAIVGSHAEAQWSAPMFAYWTAGGGLGRVSMAGRYTERSLAENGIDLVSGSLGDLVINLELATGHYSGSSVWMFQNRGTLVGKGSVPFVLNLSTTGQFDQGDFNYPGRDAGFVKWETSSDPQEFVYLFCTAGTAGTGGPFNPILEGAGCLDPIADSRWLGAAIVESYPYQPDTGLINATGGAYSDIDFPWYWTAGDQRWSEVLVQVPEPHTAILQVVALILLVGLRGSGAPKARFQRLRH